MDFSKFDLELIISNFVLVKSATIEYLDCDSDIVFFILPLLI